MKYPPPCCTDPCLYFLCSDSADKQHERPPWRSLWQSCLCPPVLSGRWLWNYCQCPDRLHLLEPRLYLQLMIYFKLYLDINYRIRNMLGFYCGIKPESNPHLLLFCSVWYVMWQHVKLSKKEVYFLFIHYNRYIINFIKHIHQLYHCSEAQKPVKHLITLV